MSNDLNSDALFTIAEGAVAQAARDHVASDQIKVSSAVEAFRAAKSGKPVELKKGPPTVKASAHDKAEQVETVAVPGISTHEKAPVEAPAPAASSSPPPPAEPSPKPLATPPSPPPVVPNPVDTAWFEVRKAEERNRADREALKKEREALTAEKAKPVPQALVDKVKVDPFGALQDMGWTMDDLIKKANGQDVAPSGQPVVPTAQIKTQPDIQALVSEAVQKENAVQQYHNACFAELEKPKFSLLAALPDVHKEIVKYTAHTARTTGQVLHPSQVALILQNNYRDMLRAQVSHPEVLKALGLQTATASAPTPAEPAEQPVVKPKVAKVITNKQAASPGISPVIQKKTEMQRISEAAALLSQLRAS